MINDNFLDWVCWLIYMNYNTLKHGKYKKVEKRSWEPLKSRSEKLQDQINATGILYEKSNEVVLIINTF